MSNKRVSAKKTISLLCIVSLLFLTLMNSGITISPVFADSTRVYVGNAGSDANDGTEGAPYATLAKAVTEAPDGATIYIMSDLTVDRCARYYNKSLTITGYNGTRYTLTRGDAFQTQVDPARDNYNPAMIEVQCNAEKPKTALTLNNIILDDAGKHAGTVFAQAISGPGNDHNTDYVQDGIIASNAIHDCTITLGNGTILRNFGGMSAVRITDKAKLIMENGSKIEDPDIADRTKGSAPGETGAAGSVWLQGPSAEFTMQEGAEISNVIGRAVYLDGSKASIGGSIKNVKADPEMWQARNGIAIHMRENAEAILENACSISNIAGSSSGTNLYHNLICSSKSNLNMKKEAVISDINYLPVLFADGVGTGGSPSVLINGTIRDCNTGDIPLICPRHLDITLGPDSLITTCKSIAAGGLLYSYNDTHYLLQGTISENTATKAILYLAKQSNPRATAVMETGASINNNKGLCVYVNNGSLFTMNGGSISNNDGVAVELKGKPIHKKAHFIMNGGTISNNTNHAVRCFTNIGELIIELNGGTISENNNHDKVQSVVLGGIAQDSFEYMKINKSIIKNVPKLAFNFSTITLDDDYPNIFLGKTSAAADTKILELVKANGPGRDAWTLGGTAGLWLKLPDTDKLHFTALRPAGCDTNDLYAAFIPVDESANPVASAVITEIPLHNADPLDITLDGLIPGQPYALRIIKTAAPITKCTVTFDPDNGTPTTNQIVDKGALATKPADPVKPGFDFAGWHLLKADGTLSAAPWNFNTDRVWSDMTLKAKWKSKSGGGSGGGGGDAPGSDETQPKLNSKDHIAYIKGYPDGLVRPHGGSTRAEVAMMLYRLLTDEYRNKVQSTQNNFSDVSDELWYNEAVSSMAKGGYIKGYPDGSFGGDKTITRAELLTMLVRFVDIDDIDKSKCNFNDVPQDFWFYHYISAAVSLKWIEGYPDGSFKPDKPITRAESITVINRVLNRGINEHSKLPNFKNWPDNDPAEWYYYDVIEATNTHEYTGSRPSENWTSVRN